MTKESLKGNIDITNSAQVIHIDYHKTLSAQHLSAKKGG